MDIQAVERIAHLARLAIPEQDKQPYAKSLTEILGLFEVLANINTTDIAPLANPLDLPQRQRADEITETDQSELFQTIAPKKTVAKLYLVPEVIDKA